MGKDTEYNHFKALKTITLDTFSSIRIYRPEHEKALKMLNERIYDTNHYKRITVNHKMYLWGMIDMLFDEIEKHYTVYLYQWIDGKLYSVDELKKIDGFSWSKYTELKDTLYSGKYWIEKDIRTNEYKPYYTSLG